MDALMDAIPPGLFAEWLAKDVIEPIGSAGINALLSLIASMLTSMGREGDLPTPEDLMHACAISGSQWNPWRQPEQEVTPALIAAQKSQIQQR